VVGGTCLNIGCIPSKNLIEAAHHYHTARTAFPGIVPCDPQLAWKEVLRQKQEVVEMLRQEEYLDVLASYEGVTLLRRRAKLLEGGRVRVGEQEVKARKVIVATGTRPAMPLIPGLEPAGALDSTTVMELEALPQSMIVIGGGAIGLELGQAFARFGVGVIVVEAMVRIVPTENPSPRRQELIPPELIPVLGGGAGAPDPRRRLSAHAPPLHRPDAAPRRRCGDPDAAGR
jgi:mercuric reductase